MIRSPRAPRVVDDHQEPGKCAAPLAQRNDRTGGRLLEPLGSACRQRLPAPGPVPPHELQGKPQVSTASKVQRSDIHQPAHHPGSRFPGHNNSETRAVMGRIQWQTGPTYLATGQ